MHAGKCFAAAAVVAVVSMGCAARAGAQSALDSPSVTVVATSRVSIQLAVVAGPSGAPAGFAVHWIRKADYDRLGGWPDVFDPALVTCVFFGTPTLNPSTGSYVLPPNGEVQVELGDLFDETGVKANNLSELIPGEDYVVRARAQPGSGLEASAYSPDCRAATRPIPIMNCTYTQGFWKNHPEYWPVADLTLGTVTYSAAQLLAILNEPARGNGLVSLAHQLIAARLSIANGADPSPVASALAAADALIGALVVPPVGSGSLSPASVNAVKDVLDSYNNGRLSVPHCGATPARTMTWGGIKAFYH